MARALLPYRFYRSILLIWDLVTLNAIIVFITSLVEHHDINEGPGYLNIFFFFNLAWLTSVSLTTLYLSRQWLSFEVFLKKTVQCYFITSLIVLGLIFILKYNFSRLFIFSFMASFGLMLFVNRIVFSFLVREAKSRFNKRVVILGNNQAAHNLISYFKTQSQFITVVGCFFDSEESRVSENSPAFQAIKQQDEGGGSKPNYLKIGNFPAISQGQDTTGDALVLADKAGVGTNVLRSFWKKNRHMLETPVLGGISDCMDFVRKNDISEVYSTISPAQDPKMYDFAVKAEEDLIHFKFVLDIDLFMKRRFHVDFIENHPVLSLRPEPLEDIGNRIRKRAWDLVVSVSVIVFILSWLTPLMAILIKLESKGPVFFLQKRSGRRNKPFWCIKFRSLRVNDESDSKQVTKNDNRVTRIGRFIRKTNIDELPQFFNVLTGDMSVVGPRPHMLKHTEEFHAMYKEYMIRHFVKPGITGLAQVKGFRGEIKDREYLKGRIEHDVYYMENWSLWFDIKLMLATVMVTIEGDKNAY